MGHPHSSGFQHYAALDGVRGLAVLAVVLHHVTARVPGGFLGVDVFFVLSGFLITTLLLKEHARDGDVDLRAFYVRRVLRLMPASLCALLLGGLAVASIGSDAGAMPYSRCVAAVMLYASNWVTAFDPNAMGILGHTWSLSIEEQFYLVWPLLFWRLLRSRVSSGALLGGLLAVVGASTAFRLWAQAAQWSTSIIYMHTAARLDGLSLGCACAVLLDRRPDGALVRGLSHPLSAVLSAGLLAVGALTVHRDTGPGWVLAISLANLAAASLVLFSVRADTTHSLLGRLLSWRPLVVVGQRSYGLYLYHLIILRWMLPPPGVRPPVWQLGAALLVTVLVTEGLFRWVERPILGLRSAALRLVRAGARVEPKARPE
ncbi:acyltransferase [Archangium violaceum]|uniref:acyltransferase family protein n=1 Tax=Archangium violaceum TaxID=83451 RepID=UPI001951D9FA|nr:acyltransferase [Archangium violaceum]QRN98917.1 acyltransferase [Archangium violaceum]